MSGCCCQGPYSQVDQEHLLAHLCPCPQEAPGGQEDPVAPEARVVLLAPDLPVWQNKTFPHHYSVILLDPVRNGHEERGVE